MLQFLLGLLPEKAKWPSYLVEPPNVYAAEQEPFPCHLTLVAFFQSDIVDVLQAVVYKSRNFGSFLRATLWKAVM